MMVMTMLAAVLAGVVVDFGATVGPVKPVNGVGQPPMIGSHVTWDLMPRLYEAGIPYSRLHDVGGWLGGGLYVDVPCLFPNFDADETDPKNYRFAHTDDLLKQLDLNGAEPFFRLGVTIENFVQFDFPAYNIHPPKDYAKWARICEHIIRHYTEGWANGPKMKITYWEIWNEPDTTPDVLHNLMWRGTFRQYIDLYGAVAPYLKAKFPDIRIGGYASCGLQAGEGQTSLEPRPGASEGAVYHLACAIEFLEAVRKNGWPLDFFSYHSYGEDAKPDRVIAQTAYLDWLLNRYGFTRGKTERILNEWLPSVGLKHLGTSRQAAAIAAEMIALQNGPCDLACIYDAKCGMGKYSPLFSPLDYTPRKAYWVFCAFNELRKLGTAVAAPKTPKDVYAAAATDGADNAAVLVANVSGAAVPARFDFGPDWVVAESYVIDATRDYVAAPMPDTLDDESVWLLRLTKGVKPAGADRCRIDATAQPPVRATDLLHDEIVPAVNGDLAFDGASARGVITEGYYRDYRLTFEYRVDGAAKGGNPLAGVIFHSRGRTDRMDGAWAEGFLLDLQSQGCGDLVVFSGDGKGKESGIRCESRVPKAEAEDRTRKTWTYEPEGAFVYIYNRCRVKALGARPAEGWNRVELVCKGDEATFSVNGKTVNWFRWLVPGGGRIQFVSRDQAIAFRNVTLAPLCATAAVAAPAKVPVEADVTGSQTPQYAGPIDWNAPDVARDEKLINKPEKLDDITDKIWGGADAVRHPRRNDRIRHGSFVDPFVGTSANGHTTPAAAVPFGMVQAGPDTGNGDWHHCSGYRHEETNLFGFTQTHLSGTGGIDLGDFRLLPFVDGAGGARALPRVSESVLMDKASERAEPGFYAVTAGGVATEITATRCGAVYRFRFPSGGAAKILFDNVWTLHNPVSTFGEQIEKARFAPQSDRCGFTAYHRVNGWAKGRDVYCAASLSVPWTSLEELPRVADEKAGRYVMTFPVGTEDVELRLALSRTDEDAARRNLAAELPATRAFGDVRRSASDAWEAIFSRVEAKGTREELVNLYTALYHVCYQPNNISDVGEKPYYTTFSLWDTFRAAHPLYTELVPERVPGMVDSMLADEKKNGYLPIWTLWGVETQCMIGTHSVPVVVDAYLKGLLPTVDTNALMQAIHRTLSWELGRRKDGWPIQRRFGYYPQDLIEHESVSRTLECAYDDACAARFAAAIGDKKEEAYFRKLADGWRNVFDAKSGFMRPKNLDGTFVEPFSPFRQGYGSGFTEGNSWQYTWHVLHEPEALIAAMGGKTAFAERLDALFRQPEKVDGMEAVADATGLIGQYAHGNEPSHHTAFLFALAGRPERTDELVREICTKFYRPTPEGLCGNDDCGQMSAWYVYACLGRYPVDPCGGRFVNFKPVMKHCKIKGRSR